MSDSLSDYSFELPPERIASRPLPERDASRMLVLHRESGRIEHRYFRDFAEYLNPGDLVLLNNSRVIKARLSPEEFSGEIMLVEKLAPGRWICLVRPGRKMRLGQSVAVAGTRGQVKEVLPMGERVIEFDDEPDLERYGTMPIPPYFKRDADAEDTVRYQTTFADTPGSVAAPTAGLHFTPERLAHIPHAFLTLHVGMGTFQSVKTANLSDHKMHKERYAIPAETARAINAATRVVAVGTTCARVLESQPEGPIEEKTGETSIFIRPPYSFRHVDVLLTNFHLPESTLLMLVSALAGRERVIAAYAEAIREQYRFFSYGDCMLIL